MASIRGGSPHADVVREHGDALRGFRLHVEKTNQLIRMDLWGLWDSVLAERFRAAVVDLAGGLAGKPWAILVDARRYSVQSPDVTEIRRAAMVDVAQRGCVGMANVVASATYVMQFSRIAAASHINTGIFVSEADAREWIGVQLRGAAMRPVPSGDGLRRNALARARKPK
jgi:hypothetical protein